MSSDNESASGGEFQQQKGKRKRGKRPILNPAEMNQIFIDNKDEIIVEDDGEHKPAIKGSEIWKKIAALVNAKIMAKTADKGGTTKLKTHQGMYTHVMCNRNLIRDILFAPWRENNREGVDRDGDVSAHLLDNSTLNLSTASNEPVSIITIQVPASDFETLITEREKVIRRKKKAVIYRKKHFKEEECGKYINDMVKKDTRSSCDYQFHTFSLDTEGDNYGHLIGNCRCKSEIDCYISKKNSIIGIECQMTRGKSGLRCGMRSTRAAKTSVREGASEKRQGSDIDHDDETQELNEELVDKTCLLHEDPIYSLQLLRTYKMRADISIIQPEPVMVCYCSPHQQAIYRMLNSNSDLRLTINSTESIIEAIQGPVNESALISYFHVVAATATGQVGLTQMLSETKDTHRIVGWLSQWIHSNGLSIPREIVTDGKSYITAACIRVFGGVRDMHEYANAFFESSIKPPCLVRIDAAFILQRYTSLFSSIEDEEASKQYTAGIGQLILSETQVEAERVIRALLTVSMSLHDGVTDDGCRSASSIHQDFLRELSFENVCEQLQISKNDLFSESHKTCDNHDLLIDEGGKNDWSVWGEKLRTSAAADVTQYPGDILRISPYWLESLPLLLIRDLKWLPLWTSVASSSIISVAQPALVTPAREEVCAIMGLFSSTKLPIRADVFIETHKRYFDGNKPRVNLVHDEMNCELSDDDLPEDINMSTNDDGNSENSILHHHSQSPPGNIDQDGSVNSKNKTALIDEAMDEGVQEENEEEFCSFQGNDPDKSIEPESNQHKVTSESSEDDEISENEQKSGHHDHQHNDEPKQFDMPSPTPPSSATTCCSCGSAIVSRKISLCSNCTRPVHSVETCSVFIEGKKEDHRGNRICLSCSEQANIAALIDSQARENWRNKTLTHEAKTKLLEKKLETVTPAIKAGNINKLRSFRVGDKIIEITLACPFDSLFQLVLSAAVQSQMFLSNVVHKYDKHNLFLDLIKDTEQTRTVSNRTLQKRYEILSQHFELETKDNSTKRAYVLKCDGFIRSMCEKLFEGVACFQEQLQCDKDCPERQEHVCLYSLSLRTFMSGNCQLIEDEIMARKSCGNGGDNVKCNGTTSSTIKVKMDFLWFELWSGLEADDQVLLEQMPKSIKMACMTEEFELIGLIHFTPPILRRGTKRSKTYSEEFLDLGHYVTYCLHGETWHRYDVKHDTLKSGKTLVHPNFVMYAKLRNSS